MTRREWLKGCAATFALHALGPGRVAGVAAAADTDGVRWINKHQNVKALVARHIDVWNGPAADGEQWRVGCETLRQISGRR